MAHDRHRDAHACARHKAPLADVLPGVVRRHLLLRQRPPGTGVQVDGEPRPGLDPRLLDDLHLGGREHLVVCELQRCVRVRRREVDRVGE
jgi:hypothetical protein